MRLTRQPDPTGRAAPSTPIAYIAWVAGHTRGSLLIAVLMYSAINQTKDLVPSRVAGASHPFLLSPSLTAWLTVVLLWAAAALMLVQMRRRKQVRILPGHCL